MIKRVSIEDVLYQQDIVFIDVRSEKEFNEDTIPDAINLPILNDKEREHIGYIYKQVDKEKAKAMGLEYAGKKLSAIYKEIADIQKEKKEIALFCYRGGMRSNSVANVLDSMGLKVYLVTGGYKAYRRFVLKEMDKYIEQLKFIVIHGHTGVGKTTILKKLELQNEPIIDLEDLARNSGSVFGNIMYAGDQITQKKFESNLLSGLVAIKRGYVFVESESKRIGRVTLPEAFYQNMKVGYHILVETSLKNRVKNIIDDYVNISVSDKDDRIINAINKLRKRLGNKKVDGLIEKVKDRDYEHVVENLMIDYYDPLYQYSIDKVNEYDKIVEYTKLDDAVDEIVEFTSTLF